MSQDHGTPPPTPTSSPTATADDVDRARAIAATALVSLEGLGAASMRALLRAWPDPRDVVTAIHTGRAVAALAERPGGPRLVARWRRDLDLARAAQVLAAHDTTVWIAGDPDTPIETGFDDHPAVLFAEGARPEVLDQPCVAVVGTRAATPHGLADARELGRELARAGVTVVSGLAIGIDGAAHEGALSADGGVVGVLGTGLDCVYPRRHERLHSQVRHAGLLVSEYAHGTRPHPAQFPNRNRIIAMLAQIVVIVEATANGGSRITADYAYAYGREVCAYPGSRRNPSARGSNELLRDAHVVIEPDDVLSLLDLASASRPQAPLPGLRTTADEATLLRHLGGEPATVDELTGGTGLSPAAVAVALAGLVRTGRVRRANGLIWPE